MVPPATFGLPVSRSRDDPLKRSWGLHRAPFRPPRLHLAHRRTSCRSFNLARSTLRSLTRRPIDRSLDCAEECLGVEGFVQKINSTSVQSLSSRVFIDMGCHEDDRKPWARQPDAALQFKAVDA